MIPSLPTQGGKPKTEYEFMQSIVYLQRKSHMSHSEVLGLPYAVFLSYLKHNQIMDLKETPEGREYLNKVKRLSNKDADLDTLRTLSGYRKKDGE